MDSYAAVTMMLVNPFNDVEALANMKVLKLYAWEKHFKDAIEGLRKEESEQILAVLTQKRGTI